MLVEPEEIAILFPAQTRYEQRGGGTETSTERRILFSPEITGRRIGETRPEWEIPVLLAERVRPERAGLIHFADSQSIRNEIATVVRAYAGIEELKTTGDQIQWGGKRLCETIEPDGSSTTRFSTPTGRARFSAMNLRTETGRDRLRLSTRRGKQFNSMVHRDVDALTGAHREDVLMSHEDSARLGLADGDRIVVRSEAGEFHGRCKISPIAPGNIQIHWPEGNALVTRGVADPECGIPDFNAEVEVQLDRN
jgi:predicted molibdopterin-dependent oxidoreductase YjgC